MVRDGERKAVAFRCVKGVLVAAATFADFVGANIIFLMFWNGVSKRSVSRTAVRTMKKCSWTLSCLMERKWKINRLWWWYLFEWEIRVYNLCKYYLN